MKKVIVVAIIALGLSSCAAFQGLKSDIQTHCFLTYEVSANDTSYLCVKCDSLAKNVEKFATNVVTKK